MIFTFYYRIKCENSNIYCQLPLRYLFNNIYHQDLEQSREAALEISSEAEGTLPAPPVDQEDLTEYKFQKYAVTYFQGNASHQYQRKPLKQPLLPLATQGDCMVK